MFSLKWGERCMKEIKENVVEKTDCLCLIAQQTVTLWKGHT